MDVVIATPALAGPGGAQSYALTAGEHIARLGHHVTLYAHDSARRRAGRGGGPRRRREPGGAPRPRRHGDHRREPGARARARRPLPGRHAVVGRARREPAHAARRARRRRRERRAQRPHGAVRRRRARRGRGRPPPPARRPAPLQPARRAGARAAPRAALRQLPRAPGRAGDAAARGASADLEWRTAGWPALELDPVDAIAEADIVVGIGRCALEGMACARPVYVHDHAGSDGWITPERYEAVEAGGFAVSAARLPPDAARLRADLDAYDPVLGRAGQDLARVHHDARGHAAELVALAERLAPEPFALDRSATRALMLLAEAQIRAETAAERYRIEARQWAARFQTLHREHEEERIAWVAERDEERAATAPAGGGRGRRRRGGRAAAGRAQGHAPLQAGRSARATARPAAPRPLAQPQRTTGPSRRTWRSSTS